MEHAWESLRAAGVPLGLAPRPWGQNWHEVRAALVELAGEPASQQLLVPLCAWLSAFSDHWPEAFAAQMGDKETRSAIGALERACEPDANRFLKFRRIAARNLAQLI